MDETWLNREFGSRLREVRKQGHMSQDALAEAAGLSRTSVVNIEKGRQGVSLTTLYRLADALGRGCADLLPVVPTADLPRIAIGEQTPESRQAVSRVLRRLEEGEA